jgi:hypothetical protein
MYFMKTGSRVLRRFGGVCFLLIISLVFITVQNVRSLDTGAALFYEALSLQNNLVVLGISLQPGYEDAASLAYLRYEKGARIVQAYLTNGDGVNSDCGDGLPPVRAARLREEAHRAMTSIGTRARFLNFPYLAAARDKNYVLNFWKRDALHVSLMKLISDEKPDVIIVFGDKRYPQSFMEDVLYESVVRSAYDVANPDSVIALPVEHRITFWETGYLLLERSGDESRSFPVQTIHPYMGLSYTQVGTEAFNEYESLRWFQKLHGENKSTRTYRRVTEGQEISEDELSREVTTTIPPRLQSIGSELREIAYRIFSGERSRELLPAIVECIDSVENYIRMGGLLGGKERRLISHWKESLENIRNAIHNVSVSYSISESILANRQLTYLQIDSVMTTVDAGETFIYFPNVADDWFVNETFERRFPLQFDEPYRLVSPRELRYTHPHYLYGLDRETIENELTVYIIRIGETKDKSFIYKFTVPIEFSPKFTIEPLTPIVAMRNGEQFIYRLTNHSRDGVADTTGISAAEVSTTGKYFRLPGKETTVVDTLTLYWEEDIADDEQTIAFTIGGDTTGFFIARKIDARVSGSAIGILTHLKNSALVTAVRRLGCTPVLYHANDSIEIFDQSLSTILVDERTLTYIDDKQPIYRTLRRYMFDGGNVVVFSQNDRVWYAHPFITELQLSATSVYDSDIDLSVQSDHQLCIRPNTITEKDFFEWHYERATNDVKLDDERDWEKIIIDTDGVNPLVIRKSFGKGSFLYVDLSLHHQFINVHRGALRLLANIISQ